MWTFAGCGALEARKGRQAASLSPSGQEEWMRADEGGRGSAPSSHCPQHPSWNGWNGGLGGALP